MTDECLASSRGAEATLTRTVTGAIFASRETQRRVVSDKTGIYPRHRRGRASAGLLTTDGEMVTPFPSMDTSSGRLNGRVRGWLGAISPKPSQDFFIVGFHPLHDPNTEL